MSYICHVFALASCTCRQFRRSNRLECKNFSEMVWKKCSNLKCNLFNTKHPKLFKLRDANNGYPLPAFIDEAKLASVYDLHSSEHSNRFQNPFRVCKNCFKKTSNWDANFFFSLYPTKQAMCFYQVPTMC